MNKKELGAILLSILAFTLILSLNQIFKSNFSTIGLALSAATVIIGTNVFAKKITARTFNAAVDHELWMWERFGLKPGRHLERKIPLGIILSLLVGVFTAGIVKLAIFLSYDTTAHKGSTRKIAGYTFTEMTDWHTALIGASGIITTLTITFVCYWFPTLHPVAQAGAFYAFFNMIPFSRMDGAQIFFGSRVLWTALALVSAVFLFPALIL